MARPYDIGDMVRLYAVFTTTATGAAVDPGAVALTVEAPDGAETSPSVTKTAVGMYYGDFAPTMPGIHEYRFVGSVSNVAAEEGTFTVRRRRVG